MTNERKVKERNININNLCLYLKRKWKVIIGGAVGIAVIFSAIMWLYVKNSKANPEMEADLTEEDIEFVEQTKTFAELVDARENHIEDSVLMKLDPLCKDMIIIEYVVSCDNDQTAEIENKIANIYREKIKLLLLDEEWNEYLEADGITDLNGLVKVDSPVDLYDTIIKINIAYTDLESCEMIAESLEEQIDGWRLQMEDDFGAHQLLLLGKTEGVFVDEDLASLQNAVYTNYNSYKDQLDRYISQMSDGQKREYFSDEMEVTEPEKRSFGVKYIFIGGILGFIGMIGIIGMKYILQDKICFIGELEDILPLRFLGIIKKGADQSISVKQREELELINNIEILCKKLNNFVVYLYADENEFSALKKVVEGTKGSQIELRRIEKDEKKSVNCMVQMENVIIMETLNQSHMLKMARFIDLCEKNDVNVLGSVTVVV